MDRLKKKSRLSLSLKDRRARRRFGETTKEEMEGMSKVIMPKNTSANTRWAVKNFHDWYKDYNERNKDNPCPDTILTSGSSATLINKWLKVFVVETRAQNGENYPPRSLYSLLMGLLRHMRTENPPYPNFLNRKDPVFAELTAVIDNHFKQLRSSGIGNSSKHTEGISSADKDHLWESGILNVDTPKGLLRAVFFYNGKCFCLRGGDEHQELMLSQLERFDDPLRYVYTENSSKNRKGGLTEMRLEHKNVSSFANPEAGDRCHVHLLDLYISKLPQEAIEKGNFYCRPLETRPSDHSKPWFTSIPIGRNYLAKMVPTMCEEAGIEGHKTNHSLRVSGASTLFDAGVPEKIIQGRTGHRSLDALRLYERVTDNQNQQVSKIWSGQANSYASNSAENATSSSVPCTSTSVSANVLPTGPSPSAQYNHCTINISNANPSQVPFQHYFPYQPPPLSYYYPPVYPLPAPDESSTDKEASTR